MSNIDERFRVDGKVAVVTGGGSGIGEACCRLLAAAGAHVVVLGRTEAKIAMVADDIGGISIVCDVSDWLSVENAFEKVRNHHGRIDILINNAGIPGPIAPVNEVDLAQWRSCMDINLFGALHCMKAATEIMKSQSSGSIVNMASLMGIQGYPMRTAYSASKFALVGMTEAVAREMGPYGVRVNALLPGAVSGENMDRIVAIRAEAEGRPAEDIIKENYRDPAALKRWVAPEEVAFAALYYASDASSAVTGDKMKVDCGRF